jgi:ubiquinone/menaquinone biosynthesis C-methylase UbiE
MTHKKEIEKLYQEKDVAEVFDANRKRYLFQRYKHKLEANFLKKTLASFNKKKKIKVLDVACGTGRMVPEIIRSGNNVDYYGLDSSKAMTSHLKEKAKKVNFPVNIKIGDATQLPYKDNNFDVCYTYHLTWHLPKELQIKMILEMLRVTKKGGYVVFDILNSNFVWEKYKHLFGKKKTGGIHKVDIKQIKTLLKEYNYDLEKLSDFPVKNSFLYSILNVANLSRKLLPKNLFHMIYFRVRK